jgi:hypothetical protein
MGYDAPLLLDVDGANTLWYEWDTMPHLIYYWMPPPSY